MAVTPDTTIHLLKVPIEIDEENQLTFASATAQYNYFISLPKKTEDDLQYQRKDNFIAWPDHIDNILQYNYVMYQNSNYSNKWFYAFITNMEYENDGMTRVYIEQDPFQTWQFDILYKPSFIEREHTNNDTIGANVIDENLNVGDVVCESSENISIDSNLYVCIDTTWIVDNVNYLGSGNLPTADGHMSRKMVSCILGNVMGHEMVLFPLTAVGLTQATMFLLGTNISGHTEDVNNMHILPIIENTTHTLTPHYFYYHDKSQTPETTTTYTYYEYNETYDSIKDTKTLSMNLFTFSDYTPKNNKVKIWPYNYLTISNNIGSLNIIKIEDFADNTSIQFDYEFTCSVGASGRLIPKNYKGITRNIDEAIALAKYPTCSWSSDAFTNWLTQNAVNNPTKILSAGISSALNVGSSNLINNSKKTKSHYDISGIASMGFSMVSSVAQLIGDFYEASLLPKIEGGQSTGDINFASGDNDFNVYRMRAKTQSLQIIDDFFSMYGYKTNLVKVPNITGRTNWNYVKTVNCNITGNIPQMEMQKIKDMFNKGVTLWHNPTTFLDYTQTNSIVSA